MTEEAFFEDMAKIYQIVKIDYTFLTNCLI